MPKIIKIINESIELDEPNEIAPQPEFVKPKKVRKPRVVLLKKELIENPTASGIAPVPEIVIPVPEIVIEEEKKVEEVKRGKGRPKLTEEQKIFKIKLKEDKLKEEMTKLSNKLTHEAKQEAKKKVITKIKEKMVEEDLEDIMSSDDEEEIEKIVKQKKKPIVIINKLDNTKKSNLSVAKPTAIFY